MFENAPRINAYCIECDDQREMVQISSFTSRFPALNYCTKCNRAYDRQTQEPLDLNGSKAYFDKNFNSMIDNKQIRCRLVASPEELTPEPQIH